VKNIFKYDKYQQKLRTPGLDDVPVDLASQQAVRQLSEVELDKTCQRGNVRIADLL